jgi:hypothetical protein
LGCRLVVDAALDGVHCQPLGQLRRADGDG